MKASEKRLEDFLSERNVNFIIPVYQRNYDWKKEQCLKFIEDLELLAKRERDNHFLGSIVYTKGSDIDVIERGLKEYIIIDGQQRITTAIIFLKVLFDLLKDEWTKEEIYENYFINKFKSGNRLKLKPIKDDNEIFEKLLDNKIIEGNKIVDNYLFFKNYLENSNINIEYFYKAFKKMWIVYIELEREKDDPQLIFESINSTGLSLTQADLIRNFILMNKTAEEQNYLFENYWAEIEKTLDNNISEFIRDYLTMKENSIPNKKNVYEEFKKFYQKNLLDTEELLKELLYFAKIYHYFLFFDFANVEVNQILRDISIQLNTKVVFPFFLSLFDEYIKNNIGLEILIKSLNLIKTYIFRRLVCEYSSNALNKIFMVLFKDISKIINFREKFYDSLVITLLNKKGQGIFPRDEEFKISLITKNIYKFKQSKYLLYSLESYNNKEIVPETELSIEHIMPQKLNPQWNLMLGDKYKDIHETYLHNIGNLTLTAYNSNLSNKSFYEKQKILLDSNLKLNKYFSNIKKWDKEEIEKRALYLFEIVKNIFPMPEFKEVYIEDDYYNLDDFFEVTGKKIKKVEFQNEIIRVSSWIDAFVKISTKFYEIEETMFKSFADDVDFFGRKRKIISYNPNILREYRKIKDVYIEANLSANAILNYIKLMAEKYDLRGDDIIFYLG